MKRIMAALISSVALLLAGCGGGGGGGSGAYQMHLDGGDGNTGNGGQGGHVYLSTNGMQGVKVIPSAAIDTSFSLPAVFSCDYGVDPLVVSTADLTIDAYATQAAAQAAVPVGGYYMYYGNTYIWRRDAIADAPITGIHVMPGRTLTLGLNYNTGGNNGADIAYVDLENDVRIEGTLTVKDLTTGVCIPATYTVDLRHGVTALASDSGGLYVQCRRFLVSGVVDTSGDNGVAARGGDGGYLYLHGNVGYLTGNALIDCSGGNGATGQIGGDAGVSTNWSRQCYLWSDSWMACAGSGIIDARGGSGTTGGSGTYTELGTESHLFNTKKIYTDGGTGTTGNGGEAGDIYMYTTYGTCWNNADFYANGGDSTDGDGGGGGYVEYYNDYNGHVISSGNVYADGGSSVNGSGGSADYFEMESWSGELRNTGNISMRGGDGSSSSGGAAGGHGGYVYVYSYYGYSYGGENQNIVPGNIIFGGSIDLSGGSADVGGDAGYVEMSISDYASEFSTTYGITLVGYDTIAFDGGDGANGGNAGYFEAYTYYGYEWDYTYTPTGPIEVRNVNFSGIGGEGTTGSGGTGGYLSIYHHDTYALVPEITTMAVTGSAHLDGGDGATVGGNAQSDAIYLSSYGDLEFNMSVTANGGNGTGANANGGSGGDMEVSSAYAVNIDGNMTFNGGSATGTGSGGRGGDIYVYATIDKLTYSADIYAQGGNAVDGVAGDGGYIEVDCNIAPTIVAGGSGHVDAGVAAGTGTDGIDGEYYIDWMLQ